MPHPAAPTIVNVADMKGRGKDWRAALEHRLLEERGPAHIDTDRYRLPGGPARLDRDDAVGLRLVVEGKRQRAGEATRLAKRREWRPGWQFRLVQFGANLEFAAPVRRRDGDANPVVPPLDGRFAAQVEGLRVEVGVC